MGRNARPLFQDLCPETVTRTTNRVVLDPAAVGARSRRAPSAARLSRFGYDAQEGAVIVRYDAAMTRAGGTQVETRRFEAREPADGTRVDGRRRRSTPPPTAWHRSRAMGRRLIR